MIITDKLNKIKAKTGIDKTTLLFLFIIILVALTSFCLGRVSTKLNNNTPIDSKNLEASILEENQNQEQKTFVVNEKRYIASKNGEKYYLPNCSGASKIKPENMIWFGTKEEAEKSGYELSTTCKD